MGRPFGAFANHELSWPSTEPDSTSFGAALNETTTGPPLNAAAPGHGAGRPG